MARGERGVPLSGARVLLTGASGGLGTAIGEELSRRGAELVLSGRRAEVLEAQAERLGQGARVIVADLDRDVAIEQLVTKAGPLDACVVNAGLDVSDHLAAIPRGEVEAVARVNFVVPLLLARAVYPGMVKRGRGQIVLMSSMAGKVATSGNAPLYSATKWGVRGLGLSLRDDLHGTGVGVSTIFPGPVLEAGMFAETGVQLPRMVKGNTPGEVAAAVARAIENDIAEIDVADLSLRFGGWLAGLAPTLVSAISRRMGARDVRDQMWAARR